MKAVWRLAGHSEANFEDQLLNNSVFAPARSQGISKVSLGATFCTLSMQSTTKPPTFQSGTQQKEEYRTTP